MTTNQLLHIIEQGESETLEFKTSFNRAVIETIIAFSNANSGNIVLGVNDDKEIVEMRFISLNYSFDSFEVNAKYNDLDKEALAFFKKRISEAGRYKPTSNLNNDLTKLGFIKREGKLTRAA